MSAIKERPFVSYRPIKHAREEAGLTMAELARRVNVRQSTISDIENDHYQPSRKTFGLICQVLGRLPGDLVTIDTGE